MNKNIIASKAELLSLLKKYKPIFSQEVIEDLSGLIELEFSVLNKQLFSVVPNNFMKQLARYNIFNRAIKLATKVNPELTIVEDREKGQLYIFYKTYKIYSYIIHSLEDEDTSDMIYLYQIIENPNLRNDELAKAKLQLQEWQNAQNPYYQMAQKTIDAYYWELQRSRNVTACKDKIANLTKYSEINDQEKTIINNVNQIYQEIMDDYGLTNANFTVENQFCALPQYQSNMQKSLVKKIGKLEVVKNIKYI